MTKKLQKTFIEISQLGVFSVLKKENKKETQTYYFDLNSFERFLMICNSQPQIEVIKSETEDKITYTLLNPIHDRKFELEKNNDKELISILKKEWNIREIEEKEYNIIIKRKFEKQKKKFNQKVNSLYLEIYTLLPQINKLAYHPKYSIEELKDKKRKINEITSQIAQLELKLKI